MGSQTSYRAPVTSVNRKNIAAAKAWIFVTRALLRLLWTADRLLCYILPLKAFRMRLDGYRKADADLLHLAALLKMSARGLPPTGNCAGSSDFLLLIARLILSERPEVVVEFGSGVSSFVIARCLEINGAGRLISFDHSPSFAELTRRQLARQRLSADIRVVPLRPARGPRQPGFWYDAGDLPDAIDLIIVDGPPASLHPETRSGAGPATFAKLRKGGMVLLDDACRPGERKIVSRWREDYPEIQFTHFDTLKGTVVGHRIGVGEVPSLSTAARKTLMPRETFSIAAQGVLVA